MPAYRANMAGSHPAVSAVAWLARVLDRHPAMLDAKEGPANEDRLLPGWATSMPVCIRHVRLVVAQIDSTTSSQYEVWCDSLRGIAVARSCRSAGDLECRPDR